jgi:hypothetical protein
MVYYVAIDSMSFADLFPSKYIHFKYYGLLSLSQFNERNKLVLLNLLRWNVETLNPMEGEKLFRFSKVQ